MRRISIITAAVSLCALLLLTYIHAYEAGIRHAMQDAIVTHTPYSVSILLDGELWFHFADLAERFGD